METNLVEAQVFAISPVTNLEHIADTLDKVKAMGDRLKEIKDTLEEKLLEYIEENGPFEIGSVMYYAGTKKRTKCVDLPATVEAILTATGGDFGKFCEVLASGAIKYGMAKQVLAADDYARLFRVEEEVELKEGRKPTKRVQSVDSRFIR